MAALSAELRALFLTVDGTVKEWLRTRWSSLTFPEAHSALLLFIVLLAAAVLVLVVRSLRARSAGRALVALPAIVPMMRWSPGASIRHVPLVLFIAGVPFFAVALADPHTGFAQEDVSYPGRRVELLVDASTSMVLKFDSATLNKQGESTFYTAVAAAETFMKRRMKGPYHDLIALIQFGNEAYVVTPFTTDYENVRLSIRLISDPKEWGRFNDWGTTIVQGIDQGVQLFKAFDFVNASGNLMILFTDGRDSELNRQGRPLEALLNEARRYRIPIYMVRTAFKQGFGRIEQDKLWKDIVERTGGRFYVADNEESIQNALREIDRLSPGTIDVRQYSVQRPRYAGYALAAVALWLVAALLKLTVPVFRTFP